MRIGSLSEENGRLSEVSDALGDIVSGESTEWSIRESSVRL